LRLVEPSAWKALEHWSCLKQPQVISGRSHTFLHENPSAQVLVPLGTPAAMPKVVGSVFAKKMILRGIKSRRCSYEERAPEIILHSSNQTIPAHLTLHSLFLHSPSPTTIHVCRPLQQESGFVHTRRSTSGSTATLVVSSLRPPP